MDLRLQLFADEAGAAEEAQAEKGIPETEESVSDDGGRQEETDKPEAPAKNGGKAEDTARMMRLAESIAAARLGQKTAELYRREADEVKSIYPSFDEETEKNHPVFRKMLLMGADMKTAYECAHFSELMTAAMRYAAKKTAEAAARAKPRIGENPVSDLAAAIRRPDVGSLTKSDILRIIDRAGKGEKITFR